MTTFPLHSLKPTSRQTILVAGLGTVSWIIAYLLYGPVADWLVFGALRLPEDSRFAGALVFFLADVPKILLLLSGMIFLISLIRTFFQRGAHTRPPRGQARGPGQRYRCRPRGCHAFLLVLSGTPLYRVR